MKWFFGLSKIFKRKIKLEKTDDLIVFHRLKNSMLKIGSKVEVPAGFNLVAVHYNKVCDVLAEGDYELDGVSLPNLLKIAKKQVTKKGEFSPTSIFADLYFVSVGVKSGYAFKTPNFIRTRGGQGKVKIRLEGSFEMQLVNVKRFMQAFCDLYATLKNKKIMRDLSFYVGRWVERSFDETEFVLTDFLARRGKVVDEIMQNLPDLESELGVKISSVIIERVIVPKRYQSKKGFLQDSAAAGFSSEDLLKMVENRLNNLQEDISVVLARGKGEATERSSHFENSAQQTQSSFGGGAEGFSGGSAANSVSDGGEAFAAVNGAAFEKEQNFSSNFDQKAPNIINASSQVNQTEKAETQAILPEQNAQPEQLSQPGQEAQTNSTLSENLQTEPQTLVKKENGSLVTCPSCGAKNFEGVPFCCVCKSKL